ncbi:MAG: hypothetical protein FJW31_08360 [Acidobacteria bacterium]|nr:hypothetical protein [Acidobacteriota bacterium]
MRLAPLTRVVVLLIPCVLTPRAVAAEADAPKDVTEFREAAHRILRLSPVAGLDQVTADKILALRARLTPPPPAEERPMSEQSRPLLTLQQVALTPGTPPLASACAMVVRKSAVNPERIAATKYLSKEKIRSGS